MPDYELTSALSSSESEFEDGYEYATFHIAQHGLEVINLAAMSGVPGKTKGILSSWYTSPYRPDPADIVEVKIKPASDHMHTAMYAVTLKIRRGHYILADFIARHPRHAMCIAHDEGLLTCYCEGCDDECSVAEDSLPTTKELYPGWTPWMQDE